MTPVCRTRAFSNLEIFFFMFYVNHTINVRFSHNGECLGTYETFTSQRLFLLSTPTQRPKFYTRYPELKLNRFVYIRQPLGTLSTANPTLAFSDDAGLLSGTRRPSGTPIRERHLPACAERSRIRYPPSAEPETGACLIVPLAD